MFTIRRASLFTSVLVAAAAVVVAVVAAVPAVAGTERAASTPTVRVVTKTFTVQVPDSDAIAAYFDYDQRTSTQCRGDERALAPGIVSATRYLAGHSFGPSAVSAFVVGESGRAVTRLQALCVKGGTPISHRRVPGRTVPGLGESIGGQKSGRATATASCPVGRIAIGAPLAQEYAPGFGRFTSTPFGPRGWRVVIENVPAQLSAQNVVAAYADVACVRATAVQKQRLDLALDSAGTAAGTISCAGGRRPLGWGVELDEYTTSTPYSGGWWTIPVVQRAQYSGSSILFRAGLPGGGPSSSAAGTRVVFHAVCGKLPRG
jgi:hypothetical protein